MRMRIRSLAFLSGLRIQYYWELWCKLQMQLGSSIAMAVALIQPVAWEFPYAAGAALKKKKSQTIELSSLKRIPASWIIVLCGSREIKIQYNKVFRQRLYVLDSNYNNCQVSEKFSCNYERVWSFEMFYIWILKNKWARLFKSSRRIIVTSILLLFFFYFLSSCLFRATPVAFGGSRTRGRIGATAASLRQSHSNGGSKLCLRPTPSLTVMPAP